MHTHQFILRTCCFLSLICDSIPWRHACLCVCVCVCGYSSELSLSGFPHAHYRSRFKEMGTHLHMQPRGLRPCVKQPGDSYQLLQSYFAEDLIKTNQSAQITLTPEENESGDWPETLQHVSCPLRIALFVAQPWQH